MNVIIIMQERLKAISKREILIGTQDIYAINELKEKITSIKRENRNNDKRK